MEYKFYLVQIQKKAIIKKYKYIYKNISIILMTKIILVNKII